MLVLSRRESEGLWIDGRIYIKVLELKRGRTKLGIEAPEEVPVIREELLTTAHPQTGPTPPLAQACEANERQALQKARAALEKASVALEEAAPFLPLNSTADLAASRAIASIHDVLRSAIS